MRPWYIPLAYGDGAGGPSRVKCHSCRLSSESGAAWKAGFGCFAAPESSCVSLRRRRMVGEGAMVYFIEPILLDCAHYRRLAQVLCVIMK